MPDNKLIVEAVLTPDNRVEVNCKSTHVPTLSYISKILDAYITELITLQKLKQEMKDAPKIIVDNNKHKVINFIRGKFFKR